MASVASAGQLLLEPTTGPAGTLRDNYTGSLGLLFRISELVSVSKLAFYDYAGNGLAASHKVRIYESNDGGNTGVVIAQVTVPAGTGATLAGRFRWVDLPTPVTLSPQTGLDWYVLTAEVVNGGGDWWYNTGTSGYNYASYMDTGQWWDARWGGTDQFPNAGSTGYQAFYVANMSAEPIPVTTSISLDKSVYYSGEEITITYSNGFGNSTDAVAYGYSIYSQAGPYSLSENVTGTDGQVTVGNVLAPGDYTATYLYNGTGPIGNKVEFKVVAGPPTGRDIETRVLIGPGVPGGALADPQVFKDGSTYYITGTYSFFNQSNPAAYMYSTDDFQTINATIIKIETLPWPAGLWYQHIWAFEIYKHIDGTYHAYGYDYDRGAIYHFEPYPNPATTTFPVLHWKAKELLAYGYDNKVVHDGTNMYLLAAIGDAGHIPTYCYRMLDPGTIDPGYTPHRIMSENGDWLTSELRNRVGAMKIHEGPSITQVTAGDTTRYVLSYTVGDYALRRYKIAFGYSDVMIPPAGTEYTKATKADTQNVWASGVNAQEVVYATQTEKPSAPNYHAGIYKAPGSGDIIEYNGSYYMIFHANSPILTDDMTGSWNWDPGRMTWITPLEFDFSRSMRNWGKVVLPTGTEAPVLTPSKATFDIGEEIVINFQNAGQGAWDRIGLFNDGAANTASFDLKYVQGLSPDFLNDWGGDVWTWEKVMYGFSGSMTFSGINTIGDYNARFFFAGGTHPVAASCSFTVADLTFPRFNSNPVIKPPAIEGREYTGTLASDTTPLNQADVLEYSLVSGPGWLTLANDGQFSGLPKHSNVGNNEFTVRVTDDRGFSDEALLTIYVLARYTGELGISDLAKFTEQWLNTNCGSCGGTDLDGDYDTDMNDWAIFAGCWLK